MIYNCPNRGYSEGLLAVDKRPLRVRNIYDRYDIYIYIFTYMDMYVYICMCIYIYIELNTILSYIEQLWSLGNLA